MRIFKGLLSFLFFIFIYTCTHKDVIAVKGATTITISHLAKQLAIFTAR